MKTFDEYQTAAMSTAAPLHGRNLGLIVAAMGLSGEAGEFTDYIKKVVFHGHSLEQDKAAKELGDVLWYVARGAEALGMSLGDIATMNIEKLKKRYPDGFTAQASLNREA